jgi:hypothetical protein
VFRRRPRLLEGPQGVEELVRHHRLQCPGLRLTDAQVLDELDFINDSLFDIEAGLPGRAAHRPWLQPAAGAS